MEKSNEIKKVLSNKYWLSKLSDPYEASAYEFIFGEKKCSEKKTCGPSVISTLAKNDLFLEYTLYLSLYAAFIKYKYNLDEIIIASPALKLENIPQVKGFLFYKLKLKQDSSLRDIIKVVQLEIEESVKYQDYEYDELSQMLLNRKIEMRDLFRFSFYFSPLNAEPVMSGKDGLSIIKDKNEIVYELNYFAPEKNTASFRHIDRYFELLENFQKNLDVPVLEMNLLLTDEAEGLSKANFSSENPVNCTIQELFEQCVAENPSKAAIIAESLSISYEELNKKSNQLAHYLRDKHQVHTGDPVAIMLPRTTYSIIAIMGVLKSGGMYVPIDPNYPDERIAYILQETEAKVLITFSSMASKVMNFQGKVMLLDFQLDLLKTPVTNPEKNTDGNDLAYVIYTSGSTGKPKGVLIEHKSVVRLVKNTNYISISETDNVLGMSNFAFDGSVFDIFGPLANGATLVLATKELSLDMIELAKEIKQRQITVFFTTTALFNSLVDNVLSDLVSVRKILFGGELVSVKHVNKFIQAHGQDRLMHVYGPTENTVFSTFFPITEDKWEKSVPIGKALTGTRCYVLNSKGKLLPQGITGELCVAGSGLARGYMKDEELTSRKFIVLKEINEKVYRTGDLVQMLPSGDFIFVGRVDNQVKLRGYRIELEEIEKNILTVEGVTGAIVVVTESHVGDKYLSAYLESCTAMNPDDIQVYLKGILPDIMVPQKYFFITKFPLNSSGKVNKKALLQASENDLKTEVRSFIKPSTKAEKYLVGLWEEILGTDKIGVSDNFFEIGGHSLKAAQLITRIHNELGIKIELKSIFSTPNIASLALLITKVDFKNFNVKNEIKPISKSDYYELSSAQKLFFISDQRNQNSAYNVTSAYTLIGELNIDALKEAMTILVSRHESLRTTFKMVKGRPMQKVNDAINYGWSYSDVSDKENKEDILRSASESAISTIFDLENGPLLKITLLHFEPEKYLLLISMHHLICDGMSVKIMEEEIMTFYNSIRSGKREALPKLPIQYKDFAAWENEMINSDLVSSGKNFWHKKLLGNVKGDYLSHKKATDSGSSAAIYTFSFTPDELQNIRAFNKKNEYTMFILLAGSVVFFIYRNSGRKDISIGTDVMMRDYPGLDNQVGLYLNNIVLRETLNDEEGYDDFLKRMKTTVLEAFDNKMYPYSKLLEELSLAEGDHAIPFFDVFLVYRNYHLKESKPETGAVKIFPADKYIPQALDPKFNITFGFMETDDQLNCNIEYNTGLFTNNEIEKFAQELKAIIVNTSSKANTTLMELKASYTDKNEGEVINRIKNEMTDIISEDF
jgi:amino acid adenylation domain-containing protein